MAIAFVRQATANGTTSPLNVTIIGAAAGNMLVVYVIACSSIGMAWSVTGISYDLAVG